MRNILRAALVAVVVTCVTPAALRAQTVGPVLLAPTSVPVGVGTPVTVTAVITDPAVLPASVIVQRYDSAGRVLGTLGAMNDAGADGDLTAGDRTYTLRTTVYELAPATTTLRVSAAFSGRVRRVLSAPMVLTVTGASSTVTITSPGQLDYRNISPIQVTGTVGSPGATVAVNGIAATVTGTTWNAQVPILEGTNTLTAVATSAGGTVSTSSVQVTLDTTPPRLAFSAPEPDSVTANATVNVSGIINDIVVGTINPLQATVFVNNVQAQVSNRSFFVPGLPLTVGPNVIRAVATDRSGNSTTTQMTVTRVPAGTGAITALSGNNQSAPAGSVLAQPLVARVTNALGQPVMGVPVVFRVVENSGMLGPDGDPRGSLAVNTDSQGLASARFRLGTRSGVGNNVVEATATGYAGAALFTGSGTPSGAQRIVVDTGNGQTGAVNQPLVLPFIAIVTDAGYNRLAGVPVTFTVKQGGGSFAGKATFTTRSDTDGRAAATLTLGPQDGQDTNVVEATFAGNPGLPAAFLASARIPGNPALTRVIGVVLDNAGAPIPGVTMRLFRTHQNTGLPEEVGTPVQTGDNGQFAIEQAPVGAFKLMADGSTAPDGPWPTLEFDVVTIAGQTVDVGLPIYLPRIDENNKLCVTASTGGTLLLPEVPGFSLTVEPGSATFPGGSKTGCITVTPVNGDKVPMSPGFGQQPRFVVTIQPVGTHFSPAAKITLPNVDGLAPRAVTEMYSYDHDLASFVSIGTGTVSDDGAIIRSDPGVGVIKAGWHCGGNPNPTGSAGTCPECQKCQGTSCVTDNSKTPQQLSPTDCRKQTCSGGGVITVNDNSEQPTDVCEECNGGTTRDRADGSTPADSGACCFQGERVNKFGNELGILFDGDLATKCPNRVQNTTSGGPFGNGLHQVDGCSGGVPPNEQDPMLNSLYLPYGLMAQAPTAFGLPIGGGTVPVPVSGIGNLPCNQHDLCYQTCAPGGSAQTSAARAACDDGMEARMDAVCEAAFPSTCPSSFGTLQCAAYQLQRLDCFAYSGIYRSGLGAFGGSAFAERQTQFCQCCQ